jgi:hypothetical protein
VSGKFGRKHGFSHVEVIYTQENVCVWKMPDTMSGIVPPGPAQVLRIL